MPDLISRLLDLAVAIQQIPAPTFHEGRRAEFVRGLFVTEGLVDVEMDEAGNVYGRWTSERGPTMEAAPHPSSTVIGPLVVSAHLDTVFPESTDLSIRREAERVYGSGIGDNALGLAGLFGLLWLLRERNIELPGDLWLVANVGEEGLGDLRGMKAVAGRFGDEAKAYIIIEGMSLGHVYHRALGVRRYRITVRTEGGHSWRDHGSPSAIHELAALVTQITALKLPKEPLTTSNVGVISGGTSVNTIAAEAGLELDLRSEGVEALEQLAGQVEEISRSASGHGVEVEMQLIGQRPAGEIPAKHPLVKLAQECLRGQGIQPKLAIGSTDANVPLSRGLPAVTVGLTTGAGAHTVHEYIEINPLKRGMEQLVRLVSGIR